MYKVLNGSAPGRRPFKSGAADMYKSYRWERTQRSTLKQSAGFDTCLTTRYRFSKAPTTCS